MGRVAQDRKEDSVLPCNYFHMITGTGAGGLLAILLGVLDLSIERALEEFIGIYNRVVDASLTPSARSEMLEAWMTDLLERSNLPKNQPLMGTGTCPTFVCATAIRDLSVCHRLRNYKIRTASVDVSVIEAIRATWASPGLFTSIYIGPPRYGHEFVGGDCAFSNPSKEAIREAYEYFGPIRRVDSIISLGYTMPSCRRPANSLAGRVTFYDTDLISTGLKAQVGTTGVYRRYAIEASPDPLYSLRADSVDLVVAQTKTYIQLVNSELSECLKPSPTKVATKDLYRPKAAGGFKRPMEGLPLLSPYFVARTDITKAIDATLNRLDDTAMRILVLTGIAGSGKSQCISKYMRDNESRFSFVFCIDASSATSIESALVAKTKAYDVRRPVKTISDALSVIAEPDWMGGRWVIIYDGADDSSLDILNLLPKCQKGTIIITSRNPKLQALSPSGSINLDVMSPDDATALLLKTALPAVYTHSISDMSHARAIVEELGCLAVAVSQAGQHIQIQGGIDNYLDHLRKERSTTLRLPARARRVEGHPGIYAVLDATIPALSRRAVNMLNTLCFFKPTGIPLEALLRASRCQFANQAAELIPRSSDYTESVDRLCNIFIPATPDGAGIWPLLDELQRYNLVEQTHLGTSVSLQFHNFVFAWVKDRLSAEDTVMYQSLAVRVLASCLTDEDEDLYNQLFLHVQYLSQILDGIHVNDRVGFYKVIRHCGEAGELRRICDSIYKDVLQVHGSQRAQASDAALYLADAYRRNGHPEMAANMENGVVKARTGALGSDHRETIDAIAWQARGMYQQRQLNEAEALQREILLFQQTDSSGDTLSIARAAEDLAETLAAKTPRSPEALKLMDSAIDSWKAKHRASYWRVEKLTLRLEQLGYPRPPMYCRAPPRPPFYERECFSLLGQSMEYVFAAKSLGIARWEDLVHEQQERQKADPSHIQKLASLALSSYQRADQEALAVALKILALDLRARFIGEIEAETLKILEDLSVIPTPDINYRDEVKEWEARHKRPVTVEFAEAGPEDARHYLGIYTLERITECVGEWKPQKSLAQESAAKEVFKILQLWTLSV